MLIFHLLENFGSRKNSWFKASRALFSIKQSLFSNNINRRQFFMYLIRLLSLLQCTIVKFGSHIKHVTKRKHWMKCLIYLLRFWKFVLGVHSKATNFAVYSELGRLPLIIGGKASCVSYWLHVICSNRENLASKAYLEQFNSSGEKYAWLNFVKKSIMWSGIFTCMEQPVNI